MISPAVRLEREKRAAKREERLWGLVTDPTVKRLLLLSAIIGYSAHVSALENPGRVETALSVALPTVGIPMLAADAGITDWKVLLALGAACGGIATIASEGATDAVTLEGPGGVPLISLLGPIAHLRFAAEQIGRLRR